MHATRLGTELTLDAQLVSICIPTYNPDLSYLKQLLQSIEQQDWPSIEVVISDDYSSSFEQWSRELPLSRFPRTVVRAQESLGMAGNWNQSVRLATGEFVLVVGQDDVLSEGGVTALVEAACEHDVDVVFGGQGYIGSLGFPIKNPSRAVRRDAIFLDSEFLLASNTVIEIGLIYGNVLGDPCSTLIRRASFMKTQGFNREFSHSADLEFWLQFAAAGNRCLVLRQVVASHRSHGENATRSHVASGVTQTDRIRLHENFSYAIPDHDTWNRSVARLYVHGAFDLIRHRVWPMSGYPTMRGSRISRFMGFLHEIGELTGFRKPRVPSLVSPFSDRGTSSEGGALN